MTASGTPHHLPRQLARRDRWAAFALGFALGAAALATAALLPAEAQAAPKNAPTTERRDRTVDEAALSAHRAAMLKLVQLAKSKKNTPQEPVFLLRVAEIMHQSAAIEFRIAHGKASGTSAPIHLEEYRKLLKQSIDPLTQIITRYPKDAGVKRAFFLRGKAYAETDQKPLAVADFKHLLDNYPKSLDLASASFYLYDLLIEAKEYQVAIAYLKKVNVKPTDPSFPLAMDHLAWAHYYINDLKQALRYIEYQVGYYLRHKNLNSSAIAEWERALLNAALFYSAGVINKNPEFPIQGALNQFLRLRPGKQLSKTLVYFTYLIRSKGLDEDLENWKNALLASQIKEAEGIDVTIVVFENELNRYRLDLIAETSKILGSWLERNRRTTANERRWLATQKALTDTAASLQAYLAQKKGTHEEEPLIPALTALYSLMLKVADTSDRPRLVRMHFNLAEILFQVKNFEGATTHYRWIVDHGQGDIKRGREKVKPGTQANSRTEASLVEEARLKAIASRYEALNARGLFPKELTARHLDQTQPTPLPAEVSSWIDWVNELARYSKDAESEVFVFEAQRLLYAQGHLQDAMRGLSLMARANPSSRYAIPGAALILDTYLISEKWESAYALSVDYLKVKEWEKTDFHTKLLEAAGDTSVKIIELMYKRGDHKEALARAEAFLHAYPKSKHREACLLLAANCSLALKDKKKALTFFAPLMRPDAKPEILASAHLTAVAVAEEAYEFPKAAQEMRKYLDVAAKHPAVLPAAEVRKYRNQALMLAVLSGSNRELQAALESKSVCASPKDVECERYRAVSELVNMKRAPTAAMTKKTLEDLNRADPSNRLYFATVALEDRKHLQFDDYLKLFGLLTDATDWILRYSVLTPLSYSLPDALKSCRKQVKQLAKLKIDKKAIAKRVQFMERMETSTGKLLEMPSVLVRVNVLNELANLYNDFALELKGLPVPAGLDKDGREAYRGSVAEIVSPFEQKRLELRKKAFDLASETAVGDDLFESVSNSYFTEAPEVAASLRPEWISPRLPPIGVGLLERLDAPGEWTKPGTFKAAIYTGIKNKEWPRAAFFMQELQDHKQISDELYLVVKAVALVGAGAQAEALVKLGEAVEKLPNDHKVTLLLEMIPRFYRSYSKARVKTLVEQLVQLRKPAELGTFALTIAHAAKWSGAEVPSGYREDLFAILPAEAAPAAAPPAQPHRLPADEGAKAPAAAPEKEARK